MCRLPTRVILRLFWPWPRGVCAASIVSANTGRCSCCREATGRAANGGADRQNHSGAAAASAGAGGCRDHSAGAAACFAGSNAGGQLSADWLSNADHAEQVSCKAECSMKENYLYVYGAGSKLLKAVPNCSTYWMCENSPGLLLSSYLHVLVLYIFIFNCIFNIFCLHNIAFFFF